MDFIGSIGMHPATLAVLAALAVVSGVALLVGAAMVAIHGYVGLGVGLNGIVLTVCAILLAGNDSAHTMTSYGEQIEARYGLTLSADQLHDLDFPGMKPEPEEATFGTALVDRDAITLGWDGEQFLLFETDRDGGLVPLAQRGS